MSKYCLEYIVTDLVGFPNSSSLLLRAISLHKFFLYFWISGSKDILPVSL